MYLTILKKDLKQKKTMNLILLIFIILASTFIAGSMNNMVSVMTAMDYFFEKAEVPDYWICMTDRGEADRFREFAHENDYHTREQELMQADPGKMRINGQKFNYSNTVNISTLESSIRIFDKEDQEITKIEEGKLYVTGEMLNNPKTNLKLGDTVKIDLNGKTKSFVLAGGVKDALFGSSMIGMTRFLVSEQDYRYFYEKDAGVIYSMHVYTDEEGFMDRFNSLDINAIFNEKQDTIKSMYIMDMVIAGVMLIVSICLILISMVILRFTIHFTMSEEFREIGVMKAIGIKNSGIRRLYIIKYLGISVIGSCIGLLFSIPFEKLMLGSFSQNIMMPGGNLFWLNLLCALSVAAVVVLFCYLCTRQVEKISPIDAMRNGRNGERYSRKGVLHLSSIRLAPVTFMAVNDIFSEIRRFIIMILIFTIGILLITVPINTINTVQSDKLMSWFSMAECDHVISKEQMFNRNSNNRETVEEYLNDIRKKLAAEGVEAEVFEEVLFRMNISHSGKKTSSLAFQGLGDITADQYTYLRGTAPEQTNEVAITHIIADRIDADIGDTVEIKEGNQVKKYIVTAIYQTMNNLGEGIRFCEKETIDYAYASGSFGAQVRYADQPDQEELSERMKMLREFYPDEKVYTAGGYINYIIGDVVGRIQGLKQVILLVVLCINILVTILMVKSFLAKEKGEIAMLKAIGFKNHSLIVWQTLRIGLVLLAAVVIGIMFSTPLSKATSGQIFRIMGAYNIEFDVVPLEVYVIYPAIVLSVTVFAGFLASLQIRKISASETSNIE